jgi:hypothetical protein
MKKIGFYCGCCVLILASLACRLPFFNHSVETLVVSTATTTLEEPTPLAHEPTVHDEAGLEPSSTPTEEEIAPETQVFGDNGVEIILPASYALGDVEKDLAFLVEGLQALSEEDAQDIQTLYEQNKEDIILWGYDTASPAQHMTSLLILKNEEFAGMSLAIISAFANALLGDEVDSLSQERMTLGGRDVLRFLTTAENAGVETAQAIYLFNEGGELWVVGFFTNQAQIEQRLPTFDAAAASFAVQPAE